MSVLLQEKTKPILSVDEQIDKLKKNGVTFKYVSEDHAKEYLRKNNYYFKLTSYRKNFLKKEVDGKKMYIDLDFAYLQDLAIIDMELRYLLVDLSLDIEHWTKIYLLNLIQLHNEDGYEIVNDFLDSLDKNQYDRLENEVLRNRNSIYCEDLINSYPDLKKYPIWVFIEVISFGTLISFYKFCGERYNDKMMSKDHFILKMCKSVRNAAAHSNCIINDLNAKTTSLSTSYLVTKELANIEKISKVTRIKKMSNGRIQQVISLLYMHKKLIPSEGVRKNAVTNLQKFSDRIKRNGHYYDNNDLIRTTFEFLNIVIDNWYPVD